MNKITNDLRDHNKNTNENTLAEIKQLGMVMGGAILIEEKKLEKVLKADSKELNKTIKDEVGDELKKINETLKNLKGGLLGNKTNTGTPNTPSEPPRESTQLGSKETPVSLKEQLMSTVGGIKARSEATKEFFKSPIKNIKASLGGFASNIQNKAYKGMQDIGDIISAPAGYNPEKEQFAKDYALRTDEGRQRDQAKRNEMRYRIQEGIDSGKYSKEEGERRFKEAENYVSDETLALGRDKYSQTKNAQQELSSAREDISAVEKRGFKATDTEQSRLDAAQANLAAVDPRVKEAEQNLKEIKKEEVRASEKENDDNVTSSSEAMSKSLEDNNVIIKELLDTTKQQLDSVKKISESIAPKEPVDLDLQYQPVTKKLDELITTVKEKEFTAPAAGGGVLDSAKDLKGLMDVGKGKLGGKIAQGGRLGGNIFKGAGGLFSAGGAVAAATTIGGGLALNYGLTKGADAITEAAGADTNVTPEMEAQDEANWNKASFGEKIQSGLARGIEHVGSFLGADKTVAAAKAARIKSESEYLKNKETSGADPLKSDQSKSNKLQVYGKGGVKEYTFEELDKAVASGEVNSFAANNAKKFFKATNPEDYQKEYEKRSKAEDKPAETATGTGASGFPVAAAESKGGPNWEAAKKDLEASDSKDPIDQAVLELARTNPPIMDHPQVIENHLEKLRLKATAKVAGLENKTGTATLREGKLADSQVSATSPVTPSAPRSEGLSLAKTSTENADMVREGSKAPAAGPTIINNNNTSTGGGTQISPMKATPRNYTGSPLDRHLDRVSSF